MFVRGDGSRAFCMGFLEHYRTTFFTCVLAFVGVLSIDIVTYIDEDSKFIELEHR